MCSLKLHGPGAALVKRAAGWTGGSTDNGPAAKDMAERDCVYVIGAGFSAGLGYPLTSDLLVRLWERIDNDLKDRLERVIRFHHPGFDPIRFTSFPNVEQLLSEMQVNEQLFNASRQYEGKFTKPQLQNLQTDLLLEIAGWFHEISDSVTPKTPKAGWLRQFRDRVIEENAAIISFNWDLILDELLFDDEIEDVSYGFAKSKSASPLLLKPHGSLNWFEKELGSHIKAPKRTEIFDPNGSETVYAFREFRGPISKKGRVYTPLIVPPVYLKNFERPVFKALWRNCVTALSAARKVVFLGYSMPLADLHAQFIMRCGFHNQLEGEPAKAKRRTKPVGAAEVVIVNPDWNAAQRVSAIVGPKHKCKWVSTPVSEWVEGRLA